MDARLLQELSICSMHVYAHWFASADLPPETLHDLTFVFAWSHSTIVLVHLVNIFFLDPVRTRLLNSVLLRSGPVSTVRTQLQAKRQGMKKVKTLTISQGDV